MSNSPNVVHQDEMPWTENSRGSGFAFKRKLLGQAAGGLNLGCSLFEVSPGKSAWPFHYHWANEEAIYVLGGIGTLRLGDEKIEVRAGDYIAMPRGPTHPHRLINTSNAPLRYLCFSTMIETEVCVYPDSKKVGVGIGPAGKKAFAAVYRRGTDIDYYDGEPDA
ncbi:MAG TPA: cupin domain-containing protein [Candidatus Binataceae bacterium]|nr:cupin domain-containing protein [Candidatus Binataceae bacterium]